MGWALACKRGTSKNCPVKVKELADSMSEAELEKYAKTSHEDLPEKVKESLVEIYNAFSKEELEERGLFEDNFGGLGTVPGMGTPVAPTAPISQPNIPAAEKGTGTGDIHDKSITPSLFKMPGKAGSKHVRHVFDFKDFLKAINYRTHDGILQKGHGQNLTGKD